MSPQADRDQALQQRCGRRSSSRSLTLQRYKQEHISAVRDRTRHDVELGSVWRGHGPEVFPMLDPISAAVAVALIKLLLSDDNKKS